MNCHVKTRQYVVSTILAESILLVLILDFIITLNVDVSVVFFFFFFHQVGDIADVRK